MAQQDELLQQLLDKQLLNKEEEAQLRLLLENSFRENMQFSTPANTEIAGRLLARIHSRIKENDQQPVLAKRRRLYSWTVAAAVLVSITVAWWLYNARNSINDSRQSIAQVIPPGQSGAILTLADGRRIVLDSLKKGVVANESGTQLLLNGQQLSYQQSGTNEQPVMNQLSTPRSRQYQLVLPDGTKVWLNAASSIRYPTAFTGRERTVAITGEAYLEVAPVQSRPFIVNAGNMKLTVLGTAFNVNAYADEPTVAATLVQGKVNISTQQDHLSPVILNPGQQARVDKDIKLISNVDLSAVLAWKNGYFSFEQAGVEEVMRQISRWYNVEIRYEGAVPKRNFHGGIGRDFTLQQVLKALAQTGVHTRLEDRTIIIEESPQ